MVSDIKLSKTIYSFLRAKSLIYLMALGPYHLLWWMGVDPLSCQGDELYVPCSKECVSTYLSCNNHATLGREVKGMGSDVLNLSWNKLSRVSSELTLHCLTELYSLCERLMDDILQVISWWGLILPRYKKAFSYYVVRRWFWWNLKIVFSKIISKQMGFPSFPFIKLKNIWLMWHHGIHLHFIDMTIFLWWVGTLNGLT